MQPYQPKKRKDKRFFIIVFKIFISIYLRYIAYDTEAKIDFQPDPNISKFKHQVSFF